MTFNKGDLVELMVQLGYTTAQSWTALRMKDKAKVIARMEPDRFPKLTADAERTLFSLRAAVEAEEEGWGDPIALSPPPKRRKRRKKKAALYPRLVVTGRQGRILHDWMVKFGFIPPDSSWKRLSRDAKIDLCEWAVVEVLEEFLDSEMEG